MFICPVFGRYCLRMPIPSNLWLTILLNWACYNTRFMHLSINNYWINKWGDYLSLLGPYTYHKRCVSLVIKRCVSNQVLFWVFINVIVFILRVERKEQLIFLYIPWKYISRRQPLDCAHYSSEFYFSNLCNKELYAYPCWFLWSEAYFLVECNERM